MIRYEESETKNISNIAEESYLALKKGGLDMMFARSMASNAFSSSLQNIQTTTTTTTAEKSVEQPPEKKKPEQRKTTLAEEDTCHAKKPNGSRCTRRHKDNSNYCGIHMKKREDLADGSSPSPSPSKRKAENKDANSPAMKKLKRTFNTKNNQEKPPPEESEPLAPASPTTPPLTAPAPASSEHNTSESEDDEEAYIKKKNMERCQIDGRLVDIDMDTYTAYTAGTNTEIGSYDPDEKKLILNETESSADQDPMKRFSLDSDDEDL